MNIYQTLFSLLIFIGLAYLIYLILRDPVLTFKKILRAIKADSNIKFKIGFFPIWGPIWLIDHYFGLKLYIDEFEDASISQRINFKEYDKYLLINNADIVDVERILKSLHQEDDELKDSFSLDGTLVSITSLNQQVVVRFQMNIDFQTYNSLIMCMDYSAPNNSVYNVKGVLLNRMKKINSYFIFPDFAFPLKLIGKTYKNEKMYVSFDPESGDNEMIYFNSNIEYFKNFNFDRFESEIQGLHFREIDLNG